MNFFKFLFIVFAFYSSSLFADEPYAGYCSNFSKFYSNDDVLNCMDNSRYVAFTPVQYQVVLDDISLYKANQADEVQSQIVQYLKYIVYLLIVILITFPAFIGMVAGQQR